MKTPKAPDPYQTAQAQAGMNRDTATTQQLLNMTNQIGPDGSLTYGQTGTTSFVGADGKPVNIPQFTATTTLSPEQQAIKAQSDKASLNLGTLAAEQSGKLQQYLNDPFKFGNQEAEQWAYDLASPRILGQQRQNEDQLRTALAGKGIREGSAAWNAEMGRMTNANTDQMNQLALTGRGQAYQEALQNRNQPINEITALMSGGQVSMPQQVQTPQTGVGGVDYTGLVNQKYQSELQAQQSKLGGLFGLASAGLGLFSDRRLKRNVRRIGATKNGFPWYEFNYLWDAPSEPIREGLMSDDVREIMPEAIVIDSISGFDRVRYDLVLEAKNG